MHRGMVYTVEPYMGLRCGAYGYAPAGPRPCRPNGVAESVVMDAVIGFFETLITPDQIVAMLDDATNDADRWQQEYGELTDKLHGLGEQRRGGRCAE